VVRGDTPFVLRNVPDLNQMNLRQLSVIRWDGGITMHNLVLNILLYLLAVYGALSLTMGMGGSLFAGRGRGLNNARLVLLVKDCGQSVEGMVRNLLKEDTLKKAMVEDSLMIVDLGSTDDTTAILEKLQEKYECVKAIGGKEKDRIFTGFE
jgi:hypothetical protein